MKTGMAARRVKLSMGGLIELAALAALAAAAGCTSLLGDFSAGREVDAGSDATTSGDGHVGDDANPSEAGEDAVAATDGAGDGKGDASDAPVDGPPPPLACNTWVFSSPVVLETLATGSRQVFGPLTIFNAAPGVMRVLAGKNGGTVPFSLYSIDRTTMNVTKLDGPSSSAAQLAAVHRSPGKVPGYTAVLVKAGATAVAYDAFVLSDSMPSTGPIPGSFPAYQLTAAQATPSSIHILPLQTNPIVEIFTAVENPIGGTPLTYALGAGIATPTAPATLYPVASSLNLNDFSRSAMFHDNANGKIYIFDQNDLSSPGLSGWSVSDTVPADAAAPQKRAIGAVSAIIHDIAENSSQSAADIAYEEDARNSSGSVSSIAYRAGTIGYSGTTPDLDTWVSTDLPVAKAYAGAAVFDAPFGIPSGSHWVNDHIMFLGPGARSAMDASNGGVPYGLNLLWLDSSGNVRSVMNGTNRLLPSVGDFSSVAATPISIAADGKGAKWAIAWVETKTDDAGTYDVVQYDELACQ